MEGGRAMGMGGRKVPEADASKANDGEGRCSDLAADVTA